MRTVYPSIRFEFSIFNDITYTDPILFLRNNRDKISIFITLSLLNVLNRFQCVDHPTLKVNSDFRIGETKERRIDYHITCSRDRIPTTMETLSLIHYTRRLDFLVYRIWDRGIY